MLHRVFRQCVAVAISFDEQTISLAPSIGGIDLLRIERYLIR